MYWLVDGFAGESHCRDLSCCWSPTALSDASVGKEYVRTLRTLGFVDIVCNLLHHNWPQISLPHVLTTNGAHLGRFEYPRLMSYRLQCRTNAQGTRDRRVYMRYAPSITTFIFFTRPYTISRVCAAVVRASSWFSRSNRCSTASVSLSPRSFIPNFSGVLSEARSINEEIYTLNRPCLTCCVARARVESSSTRIFTMISVIAVVGGILV